MSKRSKRWLIVCLFSTLFLVGCNCDDAETNAFVTITDNPAEGSLLSSLFPTFEWHDNESCEPDTFFVQVEKANGSGTEYEYASGTASSFAWPDSLDPGSKYYWYVQARADNGPRGQKAGPITFYTGPVCSGETLIAPDLENPQPAGWIEEEYVFTWTYNGGCLPISYEVQFARDAAFTDIYLTAVTSDPHAQNLLMAFPDCSSLFWRVRAFDGTSFGPWSDSRDFHYIISDGCYQWNYLSDDFAWINVRLNMDFCDQTGFIASWTSTLNPGCVVDGMSIVGDGSRYSYTMSDYIVDLGSGPCPSTGLDQKTPDFIATFGVLTPGTYCVTISRDQTADANGSVSLMDGIWSSPRSNQILMQETIDFGPGNHDYLTTFVWDETDRPFLTFPLDKVKKCYFGPEPNCPVVEFTEAGAAVPILGRDRATEWLWSEVNGTPCYLLLEPVLLEQYENENGLMLADLEIFPEPDPCPKPDPKPGPEDPASQRTCSDYKTKPDCDAHASDGCTWAYFGSGGACFGP